MYKLIYFTRSFRDFASVQIYTTVLPWGWGCYRNLYHIQISTYLAAEGVRKDKLIRKPTHGTSFSLRVLEKTDTFRNQHTAHRSHWGCTTKQIHSETHTAHSLCHWGCSESVIPYEKLIPCWMNLTEFRWKSLNFWFAIHPVWNVFSCGITISKHPQQRDMS